MHTIHLSSDPEVLTPGPLAVNSVSAISIVAGACNHRNRLEVDVV